jgi:hypothetical protein
VVAVVATVSRFIFKESSTFVAWYFVSGIVSAAFLNKKRVDYGFLVPLTLCGLWTMYSPGFPSMAAFFLIDYYHDVFSNPPDLDCILKWVFLITQGILYWVLPPESPDFPLYLCFGALGVGVVLYIIKIYGGAASHATATPAEEPVNEEKGDEHETNGKQ